MFKRVVRIVLIGGVAAVLLMTLAMVWLKTHEDELVFAAERSRQHLLSALPPDAERVAVPMPVVIAHSRADTLIPYSHALKLFAAANGPKHLITFDSPSGDGFGGHVDALYEHVGVLRSALAGLVLLMPPPLDL